MRRTHELKTWPEHFDAVNAGRKTFEIRRNDRGFSVGDFLELQEFDPTRGAYTGRRTLAEVTYIFAGPDRWGFITDPSVVVMGISLREGWP